jgi:hypothetical protein
MGGELKDPTDLTFRRKVSFTIAWPQGGLPVVAKSKETPVVQRRDSGYTVGSIDTSLSSELSVTRRIVTYSTEYRHRTQCTYSTRTHNLFPKIRVVFIHQLADFSELRRYWHSEEGTHFAYFPIRRDSSETHGHFGILKKIQATLYPIITSVA